MCDLTTQRTTPGETCSDLHGLKLPMHVNNCIGGGVER